MHCKLEFENSHLREKVTALSAQNMKNNLTIGGLIADKSNEHPIKTAYDFLSEKMNLEFPKHQIKVARRIGIATVDRPRLMMIEVYPELKELIMGNLHNLKEKEK